MITILQETNNKILKIPLTISGNWMDSVNRDWKGEIFSSESLVAVVMLKNGNSFSWCKSDRDSGEGQKIRLSLLSYDKTNLEVQVNFSIGNGHARLASFVESAQYKPRIELASEIKTGELNRFAEVAGNPNITLSVFFLAQKNVKFGRNGIWHLKPKIETSLSANFNKILASGRSGKIEN